jgi:PCO_ADO
MKEKGIMETDNALAALTVSTQPAKEIEVFPGIHERRHFLRGSLVAAAAVVALKGIPKSILGQTPVKASELTGADKLSWDDFLRLSVPMAQQLIADPAFSVDEYLYRIGSLATRLKEIPDSKLGRYAAVDPRVWFGPSFRGTPFFIIQWRMEPGAVLPAHNHPNASVCTMGYQGEVRVRNFEIVGEAPEYASKKTFRIRETRNELMSARRIDTLSPSRDNIHCFLTGSEGARGIDINTLHGPMGPFSFLDMTDKPVNSEKRIFEVAWNPSLGQAPGKS